MRTETTRSEAPEMENDVTQREIQETVTEFVENELVADGAARGIAPDTPLLDNVLDFPGVLRLVVFLEEQFQIDVSSQGLRRDNFGSIRQITDYVDRLTNAA